MVFNSYPLLSWYSAQFNSSHQNSKMPNIINSATTKLHLWCHKLYARHYYTTNHRFNSSSMRIRYFVQTFRPTLNHQASIRHHSTPVHASLLRPSRSVCGRHGPSDVISADVTAVPRLWWWCEVLLPFLHQM
jgi:hypothetical protein